MTVRIAELAPVPPMGWNSFDSYGVHLDEPAALANLQVMAERLRPSGYRYFVIDMGWYSEYENSGTGIFPFSGDLPSLQIDPFGRYVPSRRIFPRGLRYVADRAHQLGLLFGLHIMRGVPRAAVERNLPVLDANVGAADISDRTSTCPWNDFNFGVDMRRAGAQAYYDSFVRLIASWGVDFIKADDMVGHPSEIDAIANAIEAQDRPMLLSLSPGNEVDYAHLPAMRRANMVRLTRDVWDRRISIDRCFEAWDRYVRVGAQGFWPDLDMIPFGQLRLCLPPDRVTPGARMPSEGSMRWCQWTAEQQKTFLTMLALAASPMFMGGDLLSAPDEVFSLLTTREIIACNQNGVVGRKVAEQGGVEAWKTESPDGSRCWLGIFNRNEHSARISLQPSDVGLFDEASGARDVWSGRALLEEHDAVLPPDGVAFFEINREA